MSDEPQDETTTPETAPASDYNPPASQADLDRIIQQRLERERSKYADYDALAEKAQNWDRIEQASKTEYERVQEDLTRVQSEAEQFRAEATRYKAAATYGIPADHFDLLGSGTEQEIAARAEKLAALLQSPAPAAPQSRPVEQLRPGATPGDAESAQDVLYAQLFGK